MNKKGFTLIELLAVIIILGILMIIAIPSVTRYISDSRKEAYIKTAKQVVSGARNLVNDGKLEMYDTAATYYIPSSCIKIENGIAKSPYGDFVKAYVGITYNGNGYNYYWVSVDDAGQGIKNTISSEELDIDDIESNIKESDVDISAVENKNIIFVLDESNCSSFSEYEPGPEAIDTLYNQMKNIHDNNGIVLLYTGEHQDTINNSGTANIYYYNGNSNVDNSNNLIFANLCWKILRTTDTGGTRILYNGFPENNKCLDNRADSIGYNDYTSTKLGTKEYSYADSYTYDYEAEKFVLKDNIQRATWNLTNRDSLLSKYVCKTDTDNCNTLYYVEGIFPTDNNYAYVVSFTKKSKYSQFGTLPYSYSTNNSKYIGYMYGDNDDLQNNIINNKYDSTIKKYIDLWYEAFLLKYTNYLEDTVFCNDRRTLDTIDEHYLYFKGYNISSEIKCDSEYDMFSTSNPKAKLKYPVGLVTKQELKIFGSNNARQSSGDFWTMTPYYYVSNVSDYYNGPYINFIDASGMIEPSNGDHRKVKTRNGVRPLVSLKPNTKFYQGTGTKDNPYMIFTP